MKPTRLYILAAGEQVWQGQPQRADSPWLVVAVADDDPSVRAELTGAR
jgi:hypothetical protein